MQSERWPSCLTAPPNGAGFETIRRPEGSDDRQADLSGLEPGSEIGWSSLAGREPMALAVETHQYLVHQDTQWNYQTFELEKDIALADRTLTPL